MSATAANFDTDKFRKVAALIAGGATAGERAAAKARAEAMASRAGMTLKQAMAKIDTKVAPQPTPKSNPFEEFFNSPEMRAQRAERAAKNAVKREALVKEYGSVVALFDPTPWESALRDAVKPFSLLMPYACVSGVQRFYTQVMDGERCGDFLKGTDRAKTAIAAAIAMPRTMREALSEVRTWDKLRRDRAVFFESQAYGYNEEPEVYVRRSMVEEFLASAPVQSWEDMEARFDWKRHEFEMEYLDPVERDDPFMDRIEADFQILRDMYVKDCQPVDAAPSDRAKGLHTVETLGTAGYRTNADRKAAVFAAIRDNPGLGDSDIATIAGVTRQTVNNWRRRKDREAAAA